LRRLEKMEIKKKEAQDLKAACWWFKTVLKFTASLRMTWCLFHQGGSSIDLSIQGSEANSQDSLSKMLSTLTLCNYSCEHRLLRNDLKMLSTLILWSSGHYVASPSTLSHRHYWISE
jgi:hypothetical protein